MQNDTLSDFVWSDVWLILAIAMTDNGSGTTLTSIIAAGDFINHAIFTGPELRHGLVMLTRAGYVDEIEGQYFLVGKAKTYWAARRETRRLVDTLLKDFEKFLDAAPYSPQDLAAEDQEWQYPGLTDEMVDQAYLEYIEKIQTTKKIRKESKP
ncbi:MAG: hypothetical protein CVU44_16140 [Chloroflexi bacterium HGW-Chloroflexi-6]|nr:MAG: hypothetical protein CVU44_16140 [Chloroflexi bacterium HGW-Chloroflexi-6]